MGVGHVLELLECGAGSYGFLETLPDRLLLYTADGERALEQVHQRQIPVESALVRRSSLEDVFLRLTGRTLIE